MTGPVVSLQGIQAILFDLDGTLRRSHPSNDQAIFEIATQAGFRWTEAQRLQVLRWGHYYWAASPELQEDLRSLAQNPGELLINYVRRYLLYLGTDPSVANRHAPQIYYRLKETHLQGAAVAAGVPETLARLRAAGFTLGVVSNQERPLLDLLQRLGLDADFDFALASVEVNSWKPDADIFLKAVELAGTVPDRAVYVGDNYYTDVLGARGAGLRPILLDPEGVFPEADCLVIRSLDDLLSVAP